MVGAGFLNHQQYQLPTSKHLQKHAFPPQCCVKIVPARERSHIFQFEKCRHFWVGDFPNIPFGGIWTRSLEGGCSISKNDFVPLMYTTQTAQVGTFQMAAIMTHFLGWAYLVQDDTILSKRVGPKAKKPTEWSGCLEDHPRTCKWLTCPWWSFSSPKDRATWDPFDMAFFFGL